jgi:hypothetical protein
MKYIHILMLGILFLSGASNLNYFRSLGFMLMFAFWTMSEKLYRKTVKFLVFFVGFFIMGQYYFSLIYKRYVDSPEAMERLRFYNLFEYDKFNQWKETESIYFRFKPYSFDWLVLILASVIISVNKIFYKQSVAN